MIELEVRGRRFILPVTQYQLEELQKIVRDFGGTIQPYVIRGWDSFESVMKSLQALTPPNSTKEPPESEQT